jgi:hypothetical protein
MNARAGRGLQARADDGDVIKLSLITALQHAMDDGDGRYRAPATYQAKTP